MLHDWSHLVHWLESLSANVPSGQVFTQSVPLRKNPEAQAVHTVPDLQDEHCEGQAAHDLFVRNLPSGHPGVQDVYSTNSHPSLQAEH